MGPEIGPLSRGKFWTCTDQEYAVDPFRHHLNLMNWGRHRQSTHSLFLALLISDVKVSGKP